MNKKVRIITLCVLAIMIVICVSLGITKAFMKPIEDTSSVTEVSLSSCAKISLTDKGSINLSNTYPMSKNRALNTTPYSFTVTSSCDSFVGFNLYLATFNTNTLDASKIHYIITEVGSKEIITEGLVGNATNVTSTFTDQEKTEYNVGMQGNIGTIYQLYNANIPYKGSTSYDLYLYVDEDATNVTAGQTFNAGIAVKSYDREDDRFSTYVKGLYTDGSNGLYYHDGSHIDISGNNIDANDGSYRYAGSYETTQNWVCFGTDESECDDEHLYRIIGIFDNKIKLILADAAGKNVLGFDPLKVSSPEHPEYYKGNLSTIPSYYWTGLKSNQVNSWATSTLNIDVLNGTYLTEIGPTWSKKIATTEWKIGGNSMASISNVTPTIAYQNEVVKPVFDSFGNQVYNSKIGLMYISDYGFAASPNNWGNTFSSYYVASSENWMHLGLYEWTISRTSDVEGYVYIVDFQGFAFGSHIIYDGGSVRPTFYLNSDVVYAGGTGTETDPYRIA